MLHEWELSSRIHEEALDNITLSLLENREMSNKKKKIPNEENILNMGSGDKISMSHVFTKTQVPPLLKLTHLRLIFPFILSPGILYNTRKHGNREKQLFADIPQIWYS